jgi:hypothetical protein
LNQSAFSNTDFKQNLGHRIAVVGMVLYVASAPHSVAASAIGVAVAAVGWLVKAIGTGSFGLRRSPGRSKFDIIIALFLFWTVLSSLLSRRLGLCCSST